MYVSLIGVVLSIAVYTIFAWKGHNQFVSVFFAILVIVVTSQINVYTAFAEYWMSGFTGYIKGYVLVFIAGSVFGKLLEVSRATETVALIVLKAGKRYAFAILVLVVAFLAFNGISPWAALFFLAPITMTVLKESGIPRRFAPVLLYFGACSLGYTIPGCARMTNYMACTLMKVPLTACAAAGVLTVAFTYVVGCFMLRKMADKAVNNGESFVSRESDKEVIIDAESTKYPPIWRVLIPMLGAVLACNIVTKFGFHTELGFLIGIGLCIVCLYSYMDLSKWKDYMKSAVPAGIDVAIMLGIVYGFGKVVVETPAYTLIQEAVLSVPGGPLVGAALAINVISGATGSGTSGINIVLPALGGSWVAMGASPSSIARVAVVSSTALDSLPHNSGVVSMIDKCGETHGTAYMPIFWMTVVLPIVATVFCVIIMTLFPILTI